MRYIIKTISLIVLASLLSFGCHGKLGDVVPDTIRIADTEIQKAECLASSVAECASVKFRENPGLNLIPSTVTFLADMSIAEFIGSNLYAQLRAGPSEIPASMPVLPYLPIILLDEKEFGKKCDFGWPEKDDALSNKIWGEVKENAAQFSYKLQMFAPELLNASTTLALGVKVDPKGKTKDFFKKGFVAVLYGNFSGGQLDKFKELFKDEIWKGKAFDWVDVSSGDISLFTATVDAVDYQVGLFGTQYLVVGDKATVGESIELYKQTGTVLPVTENKELWGVFSSIPSYSIRVALHHGKDQSMTDGVNKMQSDEIIQYFLNPLDTQLNIAIGGGLNLLSSTPGVLHLQAHFYDAEPDISMSISLGDYLTSKIKWVNSIVTLISIIDYSNQMWDTSDNDNDDN